MSYRIKLRVLSCFSHVWLCNALDCSPQHSSVHGIFQARILVWLPCPPPADLLNPGSESGSLASPHCRWILYRWATREAHGIKPGVFKWLSHIYLTYIHMHIYIYIYIYIYEFHNKPNSPTFWSSPFWPLLDQYDYKTGVFEVIWLRI